MGNFDDDDMSDPDWGRVLIPPQGGIKAVGDANRWGAQQSTPLAAAAPTVVTPQILQVTTRDSYSRSWSLMGTLSLPTVTWDYLDTGVLGVNQGILVELQISMGVGQSQVTHVIYLANPTGTNAAGATTPAGGLCLAQNWFRGGPYGTILEDAGGGIIVESRPFAMVGALIGQSISIRARYFNTTPGTTPGLPTTSRIGLIVTPYAAGEGL